MRSAFEQRVVRTVPLLIIAGLLVDQLGGVWGQPTIVVVTAITFFWLVAGAELSVRVMMLVCLVYASIGEVLLSLVWQVYEYRLGNLPWFVPFGHVLLFLLGISVSRRLNLTAVRVIGVTAAAVIAAFAITGRDTLSVLLGAVFLLSIIFGRDRQLYATMFVLALAMELYGTWLGNWMWHSHVGNTGLVTLNPPVSAGAFYCLLDLLVVATMRAGSYFLRKK